MGLSTIGPVMQLAFYPSDFDAAIRYWTQSMGVGPFFLLENVRLKEMTFRGEPSDFIFSMAISYWGDMQIELIRPENDAPNMYRGKAGEGLHHTCILTEDFAVARETALASGATPLVEARVGRDGAVIYVETGGGPGSIVEILKPASGSAEVFAMIRHAAQNWDGAEPLRKLG